MPVLWNFSFVLVLLIKFQGVFAPAVIPLGGLENAENLITTSKIQNPTSMASYAISGEKKFKDGRKLAAEVTSGEQKPTETINALRGNVNPEKSGGNLKFHPEDAGRNANGIKNSAEFVTQPWDTLSEVNRIEKAVYILRQSPKAKASLTLHDQVAIINALDSIASYPQKFPDLVKKGAIEDLWTEVASIRFQEAEWKELSSIDRITRTSFILDFPQAAQARESLTAGDKAAMKTTLVEIFEDPQYYQYYGRQKFEKFWKTVTSDPFPTRKLPKNSKANIVQYDAAEGAKLEKIPWDTLSQEKKVKKSIYLLMDSPSSRSFLTVHDQVEMIPVVNSLSRNPKAFGNIAEVWNPWYLRDELASMKFGDQAWDDLSKNEKIWMTSFLLDYAGSGRTKISFTVRDKKVMEETLKNVANNQRNYEAYGLENFEKHWKTLTSQPVPKPDFTHDSSFPTIPTKNESPNPKIHVPPEYNVAPEFYYLPKADTPPKAYSSPPKPQPTLKPSSLRSRIFSLVKKLVVNSKEFILRTTNKILNLFRKNRAKY